MAGYLDAYFDLFRSAAAAVARERMQAAADAIIDVVARGGTIFSCGNGGSAAIANHLACDCLKGVRTDTTIKPRVYESVRDRRIDHRDRQRHRL